MDKAKSASPRLEQTHLGLGFHSDHEDTEVEIVTDGEPNDEVSRLLWRKERPIKVDEDTDLKKLKWQVGVTYRTIEMFKDSISRFAIAQGYDMKINISDLRRKRWV